LFIAEPCLPPEDIAFDIPGYKALKVNWNPVKRYCRNGIIRGYRLIYQELSPGVPPVTVNLTAEQLTYTIENMNMEVNYTVRVLAYTSKGDGNASYDLARPDRMGRLIEWFSKTLYRKCFITAMQQDEIQCGISKT